MRDSLLYRSTARRVRLAACLLLTVAVLGGQTFQPVNSAKVSLMNGVPQLLINGSPVPPLVFFYNNEAGQPVPNATEVSAAAKNGVHIYSTIIHWNWMGSDPAAPLNWSGPDLEFQRYIDMDPQAMFLVRLRTEPPANWPLWNSVPAGCVVKSLDGSLDGSLNPLSWGSQDYHDASVANVRNFVRHYESTPIGKRIIAYHVAGGVSGEWFGYGGRDYRTFGPDYSDANLQAFRAWLRQKYAADAQLQEAWGRPVTLAGASIPSDPSRFPAHDRTPVVAFYSRPAQQDWIDFSSYESDQASQWILDLAHAVKQETNGSKLTAAFYGYTYEAYAPSLMAHSRLDRLLNSPDIDIICAPISYQASSGNNYPDRWYGGPAGFMAAVDSVAAHGKLWFNENDILAFHVPDTGFDFANRILQRDLGSILVHRAGTWWMDLFDTAPFADPRLWSMMGTNGILNYQNLYAAPKPYQPEVAVISDATAHLYVNDDTIIPGNTLMLLKNYAMKAGVSLGFYTLDDFVAGIGPQCPVYLFANANYTTEAQNAAINQRLDREGALAIWQYAPGYLGPSSSGAGGASTLTGFTLAQADGYTGTTGMGVLQGKQWGLRFGATVSPRLVVQDPGAISLGRYYVDNKISTAVKRVGSHTAIFIGDFILSSDFIRTAVVQAGVNVWIADDSIVHTDGNLLVVHTGVAGAKTINLPAGVAARPLGGQAGVGSASSIQATFAAGDTLWFQLSGPPALAPKFSLSGVVNSASYAGGSVSPGELVTIFGSDLGPDVLAGLTTDWTGSVAYQSGGTKVTFDDVPAPMVYAARGQISAVVPYSVAGKATTRVRVYAGRAWSAAVDVPVVASVPGVFTLNGGTGQAAALNGDNSFNNSANPAAKGSVVVLYATGEGQTTPSGVDGLPATQVFPKPLGAVTVSIAGENADVLYAGAAPGIVAGVMQLNVAIPNDAPSGDIPITVTIGGAPSKAGVTIAVK